MFARLQFMKGSFVLATFCALGATTYSQPPVNNQTGAVLMVTIGQYQPGAFSIPSGATVLALVKSDSGSNLMYTTVSIDTVYNRATDDTTALSVSVATLDSVQFILYSEDDLASLVSPGPVASFDDASGFYYPGRQRAFWVMSENNQEWWMISATGTATDTRESNRSGDTYPMKIKNYALKLHNHPEPVGCSEACRNLVEVETILDISASPDILWVGDLDADGKLDVILDLRSVSEFGKPTLFLSSNTKNGDTAMPVTWLAPWMPDGC